MCVYKYILQICIYIYRYIYKPIPSAPQPTQASALPPPTSRTSPSPLPLLTHFHLRQLSATIRSSPSSPARHCTGDAAPSRPCVPIANATACSAGSPRHRPIRQAPSPAFPTSVGTNRR